MKVKTQNLALIGILGAISYLLMFLKFPIPFMPPFMDFDFSGIVEIIGGFAMGPLQAIGIIFVKLVLKLITQGTGSAFTGEIQNFILSCSYVLPAVIMYHHKKSKKTAIVGMIIGSVLCSVVAVFTNIYLIIPAFAVLMGFTMESVVAMCSEVNPMMQSAITMAIFGIIPFNLIKCGASSLCTMLLYKRISPILHWGRKNEKVAKETIVEKEDGV